MWDATGALVRKILKLVGVVLVLFLVHAGISNTFFHSAAVAGTPLKIKTQLGDDGRSLPVVDRAAHQADRWLRDEFGHRISKETNIRLARSGNCVYVENLVVETQDSTGWQGTGGICLYTERSKWKAMLAGDDGRDAEEFVIHELIHSAQTELGCVDDSREGPGVARGVHWRVRSQPRGVPRGVRAIAAVD